MVLIDAYGLIALVRDEPASPRVEALLAEDPCVVATANLAETYDNCQRTAGFDRDEIDRSLDPLFDAKLGTIDCSLETAKRAGDIRAHHYHRRDRDLSLADCILLASAGPGDSIATGDRAVLDVAAELGIETVELA